MLTPEDCRALREEAVQYYHRYVALLVLEDFDRVIRDTTRNLRVLDICREFAAAEDDRMILEQFRPYITMMRARALASQALADNEPKAALHAIDEAIETLRGYFSQQDSSDLFDMSGEVQMLREMRDSLVPKLPVSQKSELRQRLQRAIEDENYELASILRDELKMLPD
ncbi:MAG: UvrB/UvrC motif-containing protein [Planctomycetota bacterium]|nr:MAG: UvrB/UvrC motif-containing protein [Planctomycetota bacterium]